MQRKKDEVSPSFKKNLRQNVIPPLSKNVDLFFQFWYYITIYKNIVNKKAAESRIDSSQLRW